MGKIHQKEQTAKNHNKGGLVDDFAEETYLISQLLIL